MGIGDRPVLSRSPCSTAIQTSKIREGTQLSRVLKAAEKGSGDHFDLPLVELFHSLLLSLSVESPEGRQEM